MEIANIADEIALLPLEAQKQVGDFVAFLQTRYLPVQHTQKVRSTMLAEEAFVGMWCEREDMQDSTMWVRSLRLCEWEPVG